MIPQVSATTAHRVERAVRETYAKQLPNRQQPQTIQNYITAPGKACWAIVWHDGPDGWADEFVVDLPMEIIPNNVFLEAHDNGVLAIFPFSEYNPE